MSREQKIINGATIILVVFIVIVGVYNSINNKDFFETSVAPLLTALIAVLFSYMFVQRKNDRIRKNEKIDKLLYRIQEIIADNDFISSDNDIISRKNLLQHRSIANKISYIEEAGKGNKKIEVDIQKLKEEFERFREFYGNHYTDTQYIRKSYNELRNYIIKMDDISDKIHISLL